MRYNGTQKNKLLGKGQIYRTGKLGLNSLHLQKAKASHSGNDASQFVLLPTSTFIL